MLRRRIISSYLTITKTEQIPEMNYFHLNQLRSYAGYPNENLIENSFNQLYNSIRP